MSLIQILSKSNRFSSIRSIFSKNNNSSIPKSLSLHYNHGNTMITSCFSMNNMIRSISSSNRNNSNNIHSLKNIVNFNYTSTITTATTILSSMSCNAPTSLSRSLCFSPQTHQIRTYKVKDVLKKRCEDCYFVTRKGVTRVLCHSNKRHKQKQRVEKKEPKVA